MYVPVVGDEQLNVSPYRAARGRFVFTTLKVPPTDPPRPAERHKCSVRVLRGRQRDDQIEESRR